MCLNNKKNPEDSATQNVPIANVQDAKNVFAARKNGKGSLKSQLYLYVIILQLKKLQLCDCSCFDFKEEIPDSDFPCLGINASE